MQTTATALVEPAAPEKEIDAAERAAAREVAEKAARLAAVDKRDAGRDFVKESVNALKAAAEAESKCKKAPQDRPLGLVAARCWVRADRYMDKAMASEKTTEKVRTALIPKQTIVKQRLEQLWSTPAARART